MSNIHALQTIHVHPIESKLQRMKQLSDSIKALEAEYAMLKNEVIEDHFMSAQEYRTATGLLLASYKGQKRTHFDQSSFKSHHPDVHSLYCQEKVVFTFLLK